MSTDEEGLDVMRTTIFGLGSPQRRELAGVPVLRVITPSSWWFPFLTGTSDSSARIG